MARRKHDTSLNQLISTQEEWEEMLEKDGLCIIDVFGEFAGRCSAMDNIFSRFLHTEAPEPDQIFFFAACADKIDSLDKYRGKCEPCFLFYSGGALVAAVRGANAPDLTETMKQMANKEILIQKGEATRVEIKDPAIALIEREEQIQMEKQRVIDSEAMVRNFITTALIKPDIVADGKVDLMLEEIENANFVVVSQVTKTFTEDEAKEFYKHHREELFFYELVDFIISGECIAVAITLKSLYNIKTLDDVVNRWRSVIGPWNMGQGTQGENDGTLRKKYASDEIKNAIHGPDKAAQAKKELALFFPNLIIPPEIIKKIVDQTDKDKADVIDKKSSVQRERTIAIIRPKANASLKVEILDAIKEKGFKIAMNKEVTLEVEDAQKIYEKFQEEPFYEGLINEMTNGPLMVLCLVSENAIEKWRGYLGPKEKKDFPAFIDSFRARFDIVDSPINTLHGASTRAEANAELAYYFKLEQTVAIIQNDPKVNRDRIIYQMEDSGFIISSEIRMNFTEEQIRELYAEKVDEEWFPKFARYMTDGESDILLLTGEDAIEKWNTMMGPYDPEEAKETAPDSLRAMYGSKLPQNAVHGPSNTEEFERFMKLLFPDCEKDEKGIYTGPNIDDLGVERKSIDSNGFFYWALEAKSKMRRGRATSISS
ncbi:hypothetical protein SNEBB_003212 [Seison nebaliae]|nr:hypothetical protein SNEBB_003212 [Seison nebaliae]